MGCVARAYVMHCFFYEVAGQRLTFVVSGCNLFCIINME